MKVSLQILSFLVASWIVPISCTVRSKDDGKLAVAINHFGCNLYPKLYKDSRGNLFFSPLSLSMAFGMLFHGARGLTAKELHNILGYRKAGISDQRNTVSIAFHKLMLKLTSRKYQLQVANRILVDQFMDVKSAYKANLKAWYKAKVEKSNFASESSEVVKKVNDWVKKDTKGKIESLLEAISPETVMIILNAVYFNGTWEKKFETTQLRSFFMNGLYPRDVPMMNIPNSEFNYGSFSAYRALELPYEGSISMLILFPWQRDGLSGLEAILSPDLLSTTLSSLRPQNLNVHLPKFTLSYSASLGESLRAMGMRVFGPSDLSGIGKTQGLRVSDVVHKATVSVDERGTMATAATAIAVGRSFGELPTVLPFVVDHPFVFAIVERGSGMVMFLGSVSQL